MEKETANSNLDKIVLGNLIGKTFGRYRLDPSMRIIKIPLPSRFLPLSTIETGRVFAGELTSDGSSLKVFREYESYAGRYAGLYEALTGKKVNIQFYD